MFVHNEEMHTNKFIRFDSVSAWTFRGRFSDSGFIHHDLEGIVMFLHAEPSFLALAYSLFWNEF